jgi:hypothetical protein
VESVDLLGVLVGESAKDAYQFFISFRSLVFECGGGLFKHLRRSECPLGLLSQLVEIRLFLEYPPIDLVSADFFAKLGLFVLDEFPACFLTVVCESMNVEARRMCQ